MTTKERLLAAINTVLPLNDYEGEDYLFSLKYPISSVDMVYVLLQLSKDFNFKIGDEFVAAMENATFSQFESLLTKYENTQVA